MRITQDTLFRIARETVNSQARRNRDLVAAYLCGSLLQDDYLLGGTTDIDLVFIYVEDVPVDREVRRLTEDVHLDIAHHAQAEYQQARKLRVHHWLGPVLNACKVMYDPQHFLDFVQASVRGQFDRADHVLERSGYQLDQARKIWFTYQIEFSDPGPDQVSDYLRAVGHAANAIASLNGSPLTERRFLQGFPQRAEMINRPGLYAGLLGLLGAPNLEAADLAEWLPAWQKAYLAIPDDVRPARLHLDRLNYYQRSFEFLIAGAQPEAALWPLLRTWTQATSLLPPESVEAFTWRKVLSRLGLLDDAFAERIQALDAYLDLVDETLEEWGIANGA